MINAMYMYYTSHVSSALFTCTLTHATNTNKLSSVCSFLLLLVNTQFARHLKITHEDSPYFRVVCQRPAGSKVAPGMEASYLVIFTPDEKKVHVHVLI